MTLEKLIQEVLTLDGKAHKPRWWVGHISEQHENAADIDSEDGAICDNVYTDANRSLIISYRTSTPKLAQAAKVMYEALQWMQGSAIGSNVPEETLVKVQKIVEGG